MNNNNENHYIKDYKICDNPIGSGGFGIVYKAKKATSSSEYVALKRLNNNRVNEIGIKRFEIEVEIQTELICKNIVSVLDYNLSGSIDEMYFTMPLGRCNLSEFLTEYRMDNGVRMDDDTASFYFRQILDGIEYAHSKNVLHRDLKPKNIIVFDEDTLKITDFGLGKFKNRDMTRLTVTSTQMGDDIYSAPEQWGINADASDVDETADIYSLGKIFYEMLTYDLPMVIDLDNIKDSKFRYLIRKATQFKREKRYQSIKELRDDFEMLNDDDSNKFKTSIQIYNQYYQQYINTSDDENLNKILELLITRKNDYLLYTIEFINTEEEILSIMYNNYKDKFIDSIESCIRHLDREWYPDHTLDTIKFLFASLYIVEVKDKNEYLFEEILGKALELACFKNSREIAIQITEYIDFIPTEDKSKFLMVRDVFTKYSTEAQWLNDNYLEKYPIPEVIGEVLNN